MNFISTLIVWTWLLGIALVVPTTLPAGGAQKSIIQHRKNNFASPIIAMKELNLLSSASHNAAILTRVKAGTPVNVIKVWENNNSEKWFLVNVLCRDYYQFFYRKGWVNIKNS